LFSAVAGLVLVAGLPAGAAAAAGLIAAGKWGNAIAVPGTAGLNAGGNAQVYSVSCGSAGNCSAGGAFTNRYGYLHPLLVTQVNGRWGDAGKAYNSVGLGGDFGSAAITSVSCEPTGYCTAGGYAASSPGQQAFLVIGLDGFWLDTPFDVPGTDVLNKGGNAQVSSVSCRSAGNCAVGGYYTDGSGHRQAFVVSEVNGNWGIAAPHGTAALNAGGNAQVTSVSCESAGNCSAGGYYTDRSGHVQAFVVSRVNGKWHAAAEVAGTAALNAGGNAQVTSVSCGSAGSCAAAGYYTGRSGHVQAFVVSEVNGNWGTAKEAPGTAALNAGGSAQVTSVSCGSAGNCSAGGYYTDGSGHQQAFAVSQVNGRWHAAAEVAGTAGLNAGVSARLSSVSCRTAGNCSAAGYYTDGSGHRQGLVVSQVNGTWGAAIEVPGTAGLNKGGSAQVNSVSCGSAGNCSAGGSYTDRMGQVQALVARQVNGKWGTAIEVPGTAALNAQGAQIDSVSCRSAGNCSAGGSYTEYKADFSLPHEAMVVSQVNGKWGKAIEVPGTAALNAGGGALVTSVSCGSAGNCSAGGSYGNNSIHQQAFVVSQVNGKWGTAIEVPGTAALNAGGNAQVNSVSCPSAGNCSAAGFYADGSGHQQVFVVSQIHGIWQPATEVPGTAALNIFGTAGINSVSCGSAGNCSAGGFYADGSNHQQAFVVSQVNGAWGTAIEVPGTAARNPGGSAQVSSLSCASAGNCSAAGNYAPSFGHAQVFVVSQVNGTWGTAIEVPGTAALNKGGNARIFSLSCGSAGNCSAGGSYADSTNIPRAFLVSQVDGKWHAAAEVSGTVGRYPPGNAQVRSVSCASAGNCSAGGTYFAAGAQAFVVSEVNGKWGTAIEVPGTSIDGLNKGEMAAINAVSCPSAGHCSAAGFYTDTNTVSQAFVVSQS
jgi:hypothetical protein